MDVVLTTCTAQKDPAGGLIPAVRRYQGPRITYCTELCASTKRNLFIFSGLYGLLSSNAMVPYYDHILGDQEIARLVRASARRLREARVSSVELVLRPRTFPNWERYHQAIEAILERAAIPGRFHCFDQIPGID